ncbi:hypothetical protein ACTQ5K_02820 [Niallia sp. Sow4_A1]|uniref:hypothetical protein n=1 Tax=Niallia sp. Sow4_A1 TaxID=3438793 RepID=UPI000C791416
MSFEEAKRTTNEFLLDNIVSLETEKRELAFKHKESVKRLSETLDLHDNIIKIIARFIVDKDLEQDFFNNIKEKLDIDGEGLNNDKQY